MQLGDLAPFEARLLHALAFFRTRRNIEQQALHCLSMYLRQSESRVMGEVRFYARQLGIEPEEMLEEIYTNPDAVADQLRAQSMQSSTLLDLETNEHSPPSDLADT